MGPLEIEAWTLCGRSLESIKTASLGCPAEYWSHHGTMPPSPLVGNDLSHDGQTANSCNDTGESPLVMLRLLVKVRVSKSLSQKEFQCKSSIASVCICGVKHPCIQFTIQGNTANIIQLSCGYYTVQCPSINQSRGC